MNIIREAHVCPVHNVPSRHPNLTIQPGAVLTRLRCNRAVRVRIRPNNVIAVTKVSISTSFTHKFPFRFLKPPLLHVPIIRISRRIAITQFRNNIGQRIMLPANEDIAGTSIPIHDGLHAGGIVAIAGYIHRKSQVLGQWFDSVVWALALAVCKGLQSDTSDINLCLQLSWFHVPLNGVCAMICPMLYAELAPNTVRRHCARSTPCVLRPLPEEGFSPWRIR